MKIVLAGGTGFLGTALAKHFEGLGHEIVVLSREVKPLSCGRCVSWDGQSQGEWAKELEGAGAVVNLVGAPISLPWTKANRALILESRVFATRALGEAISQAKNPPHVWINASGTGYYGDRGDEILEETSSAGQLGKFPVDVCVAWEQTFRQFSLPKTRTSIIRFGLALGSNGGVLHPLKTLTQWFLGGHHGSGKQYLSWIHNHDLARLVQQVVESDVLGPVVNAVAPEPVTNEIYMATLRAACGRPWSPPVPAFALKIAELFGAPDASLLLESHRVIPKVALEAGFTFKFPNLNAAFGDLFRR